MHQIARLRIMHRITALLLTCLLACTACATQSTVRAPDLMPDTPMLERPWPTDPQKFSFVIIGDKTSGGADKWHVLDTAIEEINLLRPDFAIMVGDLIPGHVSDRPAWESEWAEFWSHMDAIEVPFFMLPGNHDISNLEMYHMWREDFGRTYYSFDYLDCHFIAINTEEERFDGRGEVWNRMIDFIVGDLAKPRDARHTFLFMHKPMWADPRYENDWERIADALGTRPFSAFAGHWHRLRLDDEHDRRHMVVAATGGGVSTSPLKELGRFDHYTKVTVEGDSVYLAIIEPGGPMHNERIARRSRIAEIGQMTDFAIDYPRIESERVRIPVRLAYTNPLADTVTIATVIRPLDESGVHVDGIADSSAVILAPKERHDRQFELAVERAKLYELPVLASLVYRDGERQFADTRYIPLFPASAIVTSEKWQVAGIFPAGDVRSRYLPDEPERGLPGLFEPEQVDVLNPHGEVSAYGVTTEWITASTTSDGQLNVNAIVGTADHALLYAVTDVDAEQAGTVYMRLAADNFAHVLVNGNRVPRGDKYGSTGQVVWVPLELNEGRNSIAIKLVNNLGDWWLRVAFADPDGVLSFPGGMLRLAPTSDE